MKILNLLETRLVSGANVIASMQGNEIDVTLTNLTDSILFKEGFSVSGLGLHGDGKASSLWGSYNLATSDAPVEGFNLSGKTYSVIRTTSPEGYVHFAMR